MDPAAAVNWAVLTPALTVTEDGTVKTGLPLESDTVDPPLGAT
jgi:hypothetical protein